MSSNQKMALIIAIGAVSAIVVGGMCYTVAKLLALFSRANQQTALQKGVTTMDREGGL